MGERQKRQGKGLSPRVRGNHTPFSTPPLVLGTIPACAGEPMAGRDYPEGKRDYPRVCGGTPS